MKARAFFMKRQMRTTLVTPRYSVDPKGSMVTRTIGAKIASDGLKGRVFETSLADLQ